MEKLSRVIRRRREVKPLALVDVPIFSFLKQILPRTNTADAMSSVTMDALNEGVALICHPPKAGLIRKIYWVYAGFTSITATMSAGIYAVDATTGLPVIATPFGGMVAGTLVNPSSAGGGVASITLGTDCTIAAGDLNTPIAVVIYLSAFTSVVSGVAPRHLNAVGINGFPYYCSNTGAWAKAANQISLLAIEYSDGSAEFIPNSVGLVPTAEAISTTGVNEKGTKFTVPFGCRMIGVEYVPASSTPQDGTLELYNSSDSTLTSIPIDGNVVAAAFSSGNVSMKFLTPVTLTAGATYRVTLAAATSTSMSMMTLIPPNATYAKQYFGNTFYSNVFKTSRTGAGAWADVSTTFMGFSPLIDQIDVSSGSGGMVVHPGMQGGLRA